MRYITTQKSVKTNIQQDDFNNLRFCSQQNLLLFPYLLVDMYRSIVGQRLVNFGLVIIQ